MSKFCVIFYIELLQGWTVEADESQRMLEVKVSARLQPAA